MTAIEARPIRPRPIPSAHAEDELPHLFMSGDLILSHMVAIGSALFPEGEDFFVRSVRHYRDRITDPVLKRQVAGFIGQEALHSRAHADFNEKLARLGYRTHQIDRGTKISFWVADHFTLPRTRLAITAALEHVTATLAENLLSREDVQALHDVPKVRDLFMWHALEESEHKAVAFDVYQQVSGNTFVRTTVMRLVLGGSVIGMSLGVLASTLIDRQGRRQCSLRESWRALKQSPFADRRLWDRLCDYNRRDFHPSQNDATALIDHWSEVLARPA